jgi:UPF0755 protein
MVVKRRPKPIFFVIVLAIILLGIGGTWIYLAGPVDRKDKNDIEVEIVSGTSTSQISNILKEDKLIKSKTLFQIYIKLYSVKSLKAGTYLFNKSMKLEEIVSSLEEGSSYNPNKVVLTFKEGLRITDYAEVISLNTNNSYDDVINTINDTEYLNSLIDEYWFLTSDILDSDIYYPLEGYLAPDTYHFDNSDVSVKTIIETMLDEMDNKLSDYKSIIGSDAHYYLTMASIVELEGTNTENRKMIVGIFKNRLKSGMNLGSDVTTYYGLQVSMTSDLSTEQFASVNGYNTRSTTMIGKMPIGPICSPSASSIEASVKPTNSDYLYFVADKNGNIYYTKTNQEHDAKVAEIKAKGDWIW